MCLCVDQRARVDGRYMSTSHGVTDKPSLAHNIHTITTTSGFSPRSPEKGEANLAGHWGLDNYSLPSRHTPVSGHCSGLWSVVTGQVCGQRGHVSVSLTQPSGQGSGHWGSLWSVDDRRWYAIIPSVHTIDLGCVCSDHQLLSVFSGYITCGRTAVSSGVIRGQLGHWRIENACLSPKTSFKNIENSYFFISNLPL